jgi:GT2 family glycosyltransferase
MKIFVAVPLNRPIDFYAFESFVRLANFNGKHEYQFGFTQNSLVYEARETLVEQFLKTECEAIMFIDSDMVFDHRSIEYLESHNLPMVTAKAFKRVPPYQPCFYTTVTEKDGLPYLESPVEYGIGLLEIQGCGMACVLIRREVFTKIQQPYFFPQKHMGEDLSFCLKVKEAGVKMYCDTSLQFGHISNEPIFEHHFQNLYKKAKAEGKPIFGGEPI